MPKRDNQSSDGTDLLSSHFPLTHAYANRGTEQRQMTHLMHPEQRLVAQAADESCATG